MVKQIANIIQNYKEGKAKLDQNRHETIAKMKKIIMGLTISILRLSRQ